MNRFAMATMLIVLVVSPALAQLPTATLLGQVKDTSGAVVAGAKVAARNTETSQTRTAVTGQDGEYRLDALPVGNYEISAEKTGFKTEVQSGLTLTVAQEAVANFTIQVGEMSQTVAVTAEAPLVSTTTSSLGGLVDDQRIADLPLNGRNYVDLTLLQPGVTQVVYVRSSQLGLTGTEYSSNGAPLRSNNYLLDGAILQNLGAGNGASAVGTTLGVDGILEYRVITNNFSAEYGMSMGSQMVMVSKGGTNQFHGDVFEFLRNSDLDSRNYFDLPPSVIGHRLPEFRRNNFGGALGGPVKKNKTFFFGVYEELSQALGTTNNEIVPQAGCHGAGGSVITLANCPGISPLASVTIASQMAPLLALYPLPNIGTNQYGFVFTQPTTEHYGQIRVDQTISSSDTFFTRYTVDQASQTNVVDFPQFTTGLVSRNQFLTLSENHIFSTALLNTVRFSFSRTNLALPFGPSPTGPQYSFVPGEPMGGFSVNGLAANGLGNGPQQTTQNIYTWSDDLVYTRGRHSLKFGFMFNHYQWFIDNLGGYKGTLSFGSLAQFLTAQLASFSYDPPTGILSRHWHFNTMGFYVQDDWRVSPRLTLNLGMRYEPSTTYAEVNGYSASLRNFITDPTTTIGPPFRNPSLRNLSPRFGFAWDVRGNGRTAIRGGFSLLYDLSTMGDVMLTANSFTPPFNPVVAVSSGTFTIPFVVPANAGVTNTYRGPEYYMQQAHNMTYNLTAEQQLPGSMALTIAFVGSRGINLLQDKEGNPDLPNGIPSNGLCVNPPVGTVINPADQLDGQATSCFLAGVASNPIKRRNTNWGSLLVTSVAGGDSIYNGLEVGLNKRLSRGLQIQSSYTWSKIIDDAADAFLNDVFGPNAFTGEDDLHERTDRGPTDFDITNNWRVNAIYHLPNLTSSKGFLGKVENGWWASGIFSLQSGYPMEVFLGANRSENGESAGGGQLLDRADVAPGRYNSNITHGVTAGCGTGATRAAGGSAIAAGTPLGTPTLWFDPCAFSVQPQGFLGTEGRDFLRGPVFDNLNFSVVKDTSIGFLGEGGMVEFRAEFFNIFNHTNLALPTSAGVTGYAGTCGGSIAACGASVQNPSSGAGIITATNGTSRQIQFGLKIIF